MAKIKFSKLVTVALIVCILGSTIGAVYKKIGVGKVYADSTFERLFKGTDTVLTERGASINPVGVLKGERRKATVIIQKCTSTDGDPVSIVNRDQLKSDGIETDTPSKISKCAFALNISISPQAISRVARRIEFTTSTEHSYVDLTILGQDIYPQQSSHSKISGAPTDVVIGDPQPIPYSQAFPLLDGLFQDVAVMQIKPLDLDANASNVNRLDALIEQFQAAFQYSQTLGLVNSGAAQQSAAYSASNAFQTQLINQESQLISSLLVAQQQALQAQKAYDAIPATDTDARAKANQTLQLANDEVNSITAQLSSVKGFVNSTAPTNPSYTAPSPTPVTFPSPLVTPSLPLGNSSKAFEPSFPASKQMENQVNLLWERLANLVNTLAQTNNPANTYLVKFNTSILFGKANRKHQLLTTQYQLECLPDPNNAAKTDNSNTGQPDDSDNRIQVLDLFPRKSAVNIADEKYKDSKTGLAAMLSFFSIGGNVSYNREHLRITQALGQSAYITGYGIQTSTFGWVFGPTLGEDAPAPGDRMTFALVSFPASCGNPKIKLVNVAWDKAPYVIDSNQTTEVSRYLDAPFRKDAVGEPRCKSCSTSVAYTPGEFDLANPANSANDKVTVDINLLNSDLDREETVSVNGNILQRARDNFGRATVRTANNSSGGLLEATALNAQTWLPVSSREILLNLSPLLFKDRFPSILLNSPKGTIDITSRITKATIGGIDYTCPPSDTKPCVLVLPPVGRPRPALKNFFVERWQGDNSQHILFKDMDIPQPASKPASGLAAIQVINNSQNEPWSTHATVVAKQGTNAYPLQCAPLGEYLDCDAGPTDNNKRKGGYEKFLPTEPTEFEIFDGDHFGGPVKGSSLLQRCSDNDCYNPQVLRIDGPTWIAKDTATNKSGWKLHLVLVNVQDTQFVKLDGGFDSPIRRVVKKGSSDTPDQPEYAADIFIPIDNFNSVGDLMKLTVVDANKKPLPVNATDIGNIRTNISPIITFIDNDQMHFTGKNLVFHTIVVGTGPKAQSIDITCDILNRDCFIPGDSGFNKDEGYLYFKAGNELIEFVTIDDKGIHPVDAHHPTKTTPPGASPPSTNNTSSQTPNTKPVQGETNSIRIYIKPQS